MVAIIQGKNLMADLFIAIPSRGRPGGLKKTIEMLYHTCFDINNFIIQVSIDEDQINIYKEVMSFFGHKIIWNIAECGEKNLFNVFRSQHNVMRNSSCYFFWPISDDIGELSPNWDKCILSKKKYFEDDIFVLYTSSKVMDRVKDIHECCYTAEAINWNKLWEIYWKPVLNDPKHVSHPSMNKDLVKHADIITRYHEMLPIWTNKFGYFLYNLFDKYRFKGVREAVVGAIIHFLYVDFGENRNVHCNITYDDLTNDGHALNSLDQWYQSQDNGYPEMKEAAKEISEYIELCKWAYNK